MCLHIAFLPQNMLSAIPAHTAEKMEGRAREWCPVTKKVDRVGQSVITVQAACHSSFLTSFNGSLLFYHVCRLNHKWLTAMVPKLCSALHGNHLQWQILILQNFSVSNILSLKETGKCFSCPVHRVDNTTLYLWELLYLVCASHMTLQSIFGNWQQFFYGQGLPP